MTASTPDREQDFWVSWRASERAEWGKKAGPQACGTCRGLVADGKAVEHEECAQRATILQAPDQPGYEFITGLTEDEVKGLPARFHTPVFLDSGTPKLWVCAVCWGDGWSTQWPCKTAQEQGDKVFTDEHQAETEQRRLLARVAELEALELGAIDGRVSASCENPEHPTWLRKPDDARGCPWCRVTASTSGREQEIRARAEAATREGGQLRQQIVDAIGPTMRLGLQDAELFDEPGAERIGDWVKWIADTLAPLMRADRDAAVAAAVRRALEDAADDLESVDPVEWALAGQHAGHDAAERVRARVAAMVSPVSEQGESAAELALAEVRRLCDMTIAHSMRAQAIDQAQDTLAAIDRVMGQKAIAPTRKQGEEAAR